MARYYGMLPPFTKKLDASPLHFLIGAGIGLLGLGALKFALLKLWPAGKAVPTWLPKVTPFLGAAAGGFAAFLIGTKLTKTGEGNAMAHLVGAGAVGLALSVWPAVASSKYGTKMGFAGFHLAGVSQRQLNGLESRSMNGLQSRPQTALQGFADNFASFNED